MILWRLADRNYAEAFDGGYGLLFDGRWNTAGHAVTYCATSPSLCVLEKLVHVQDPDLMPDQVMVCYRAPEELAVRSLELDDLPADWRLQEGWTQHLGDDWSRSGQTVLLRVPSAVVPVTGSPDMNVVINNALPAAREIRLVSIEPFELDIRLF